MFCNLNSIYGSEDLVSNARMLLPVSKVITHDSFNNMFSSILNELSDIMIYHKNGEYEKIKRELSSEKREKISREISKKKKIITSDVDDILLDFINNSFVSIQQNLFLHNEYTTAVTKVESMSEKVDTLQDFNKLQAYITNLNLSSTISIFPNQIATISKATLKPQYEIYIQRYGIPANLLWDPILLGDILEELEEET